MPIHTADVTQLLNWVASAVCTQFATSWWQSRRVWTNLPTAKSSCIVSALWTHPSAVVTQFTISCAVDLLRLVTSDDIMTSLLKKLSISIKIHVVKPPCLVSKLSTESVGSRRELVANVFTPLTPCNYTVKVWELSRRRCVLGLTELLVVVLLCVISDVQWMCWLCYIFIQLVASVCYRS